MSTNTQKHLLDKNTLEMVEAGFLTEDLRITEDCKHFLTHLLFVEKMEELVKRAKEKNAEAKAEVKK